MANLAYQVTGFAYQGAGQFAYQGSVDTPATGGGTVGGGSGGGPEPWKVPQWAIEQRAERERLAEEARSMAEREESKPAPKTLPVMPEGLVSADTIAAEGRMASAEALGHRISDLYGIPTAVFGEPNDDEDAVLILLLNE